MTRRRHGVSREVRDAPVSTLLAPPRQTAPTPAAPPAPDPDPLPHVELPGASWALNGFYNHLRSRVPAGTRLSKAQLQTLMRTTTEAAYKALRDELHTAGVLTTVTGSRGGKVIVFTDPHQHPAQHPAQPTYTEMSDSRTSGSADFAIKYIPEGCTPTPSAEEKPAAKPHRPAPPAMAPAAPSGETAGQKPMSTVGENPGDNSGKRRRRDYSAYGWKVVNDVKNGGPWLHTKPRHGTQIGYTIRMMVEEFGMSPEAATQLLITRAMNGETVRKAAIEAALSSDQTTITVAPSPAPAAAPAPVDLVDRSNVHQALEAQMAAAKIPAPVQAAIRSLIQQRSELMRYGNFAVNFYREVRDAELTLTDGQYWAAAQLLADAPGWDYARIAEALRAARG